jgi:hypothetical protein
MLPAACLNCDHVLGTGPAAEPDAAAWRFCPACGQETNIKPPTLAEFAQQFGGAYLATEGALWRTLKLLLFKPDELTRQYLAGRRKHYVLPLRLYLSVSVVALLIARALGGITALNGLDQPELAAALRAPQPSVVLNLLGGRTGLQDGRFVCERVPLWLCRRISRQIEADPQAFLPRLRQVNERIVANWSLVMFVLLPLFAWGLRVLYANRGLRYTEHLVYALHLHAFLFCVLTVMQLRWLPLSVAGAVWMVAYAALSGRRVYGGRWWPRLLRGLALGAYYAVLLAMAVLLLALFFLLV